MVCQAKHMCSYQIGINPSESHAFGVETRVCFRLQDQVFDCAPRWKHASGGLGARRTPPQQGRRVLNPPLRPPLPPVSLLPPPLLSPPLPVLLSTSYTLLSPLSSLSLSLMHFYTHYEHMIPHTIVYTYIARRMSSDYMLHATAGRC